MLLLASQIVIVTCYAPMRAHRWRATGYAYHVQTSSHYATWPPLGSSHALRGCAVSLSVMLVQVCNDGGKDSADSECPLGSDCDDCGPRTHNVAAGGFLMSWVDEYWKGNEGERPDCGPDQGSSNGHCGRYCPDRDPARQGPCGQPYPSFPDKWLNEEWWGLVKVEQACGADAGVKPDRLIPRKAFIEVSLSAHAYFAFAAAFTVLPPTGGSCACGGA